MKRNIFLLLLLSSFSSCIICKEPVPDTEMYFTETQCANPWGNEEKSIESWLTDKNIKFSNLHFESYNIGLVCQACTCPSGRYVKLNASAEYITKLEELGFKKK